MCIVQKLKIFCAAIKTIAAGGGSILKFYGGIMHVGPESSGAFPGPACYQNSGPLSLTDAHSILGRLPSKYFPKIFGPTQNSPIDVNESKNQFLIIQDCINKHNEENGIEPMSEIEIALGFIEVANESMARAIRSVTQKSGFEPKNHVLCCFGGAGGLHACSLARILGIRTIVIPKLAGVLSALGLALADIEEDQEESIYIIIRHNSVTNAYESDTNIKDVFDKINKIQSNLLVKLKCAVKTTASHNTSSSLLIRYKGSNNALCISIYADDNYETICNRFVQNHKNQLGFLLDRPIVLENIRVVAKANSDVVLNSSLYSSTLINPLENPEIVDVWYKHDYNTKCIKTLVYKSDQLRPENVLKGPALICDPCATFLIEPDWEASLQIDGSLFLEFKVESVKKSSQAEAQNSIIETRKDNKDLRNTVTLSIYGHRFMNIAEQMGEMLRRVACSVNIKERLDFSCAIFDTFGNLVANAPHVPVHLGAMQEAVKHQIKIQGNNWRSGDVILCNCPSVGGSHLPDLTVISAMWSSEKLQLSPVFYVANRGHHADIGGATPGSMPPNSVCLKEEGAAIKSFKLVENGHLRLDACMALFGHHPSDWSDENYQMATEEALRNDNVIANPASRNWSDNINDLKAQIAANQCGIRLMNDLIQQDGLSKVVNYMDYLQDAGADCVKEMIVRISKESSFPEKVTIQKKDYMDDGSLISLALTLDRVTPSATFDFSQCGPEVLGNWNIPPAVTKSAVIYCLRALILDEIPLNQGCLRPVTIILPESSIVNPSPVAAVATGNVLTSQRIVDVILDAFGSCANSYGCMNNVAFGNSKIAFYETIGGGSGAGPTWNGCSGVQCHMTNTRITDVEVLERNYPVLLHTFSIRANSGGKGRYNGGDGLIREYEFLEDEILVSLLTERRCRPPNGFDQGEDGSMGCNLWIRRQNPSLKTLKEADHMAYAEMYMSKEIFKIKALQCVRVGSKQCFKVLTGDHVVILTPGGGGYGKKS